MKIKEWYSTIPNWHLGKICMLWIIDTVILVAILLSARESAFPNQVVANYSDPLSGWLIFSTPLIVITWKWLSHRDSRKG